MRGMLTIAAALSFELSAACSDDDPGPSDEGNLPPDAQSAYVDLYLDEDVHVCGRQLQAYDRFIERIFGVWTAGEPGDFRVNLNILHEPPCPGRAPACADPHGVYLAAQSAQYHEIVHAMHFATDGASARSIDEGLAEALGPRHPLMGLGPDNLHFGIGTDMASLFTASQSAGDYGTFALFTRFLLDRHGAEAYRTYFHGMTSSEHRGQEDFEREFELAFGERLDIVWPEFISEPRCAYDFWYCDERRPIELPFVIDGIDCQDPDTLGFESPGQEWPDVPFNPTRIVHLNVSEARTVRIEGESVSANIGRCGDCSEQRPILSDGWPLVHLVAQERRLGDEFALDAGTYTFIVMQPTDRPS